MLDLPPQEVPAFAEQELLYFWVFGDLHYRAQAQWHDIHARRFAPMFQDLHMLWSKTGAPAFCVSPGDIVDTGAPENYSLAKKELAAQLGNVPFYPGIGNHEYHPEQKEDTLHTVEEYCASWEKSVRYSWVINEIACIMLDMSYPYRPGERRELPHVLFSPETLSFLDDSLTVHADRPAIIFAHCPLSNTVLDRDPEQNLDDDSRDPFFFVENSPDVRAILAQHTNAKLYISGHTHSGWGSPQLVFTESLGQHSMTHINVMSPWYTGRHNGIRRSADRTRLEYHADNPDVLATFAICIYPEQAVVGARDHRAHQWLAQWVLPF